MGLGLQASPIVKGDLTVHIDANPVVAHKSRQCVQELVGLVVGQGFKALIKPESWAASHRPAFRSFLEGMRMESGHVGSVVRPRGRAGSSPAPSARVGWPSGEALVRKTG